MTDVSEPVYWDVIIALRTAELSLQAQMLERAYRPLEVNPSDPGGEFRNHFVNMINYNDLFQKITARGLKIEPFPKDPLDAFCALSKLSSTGKTAKALSIARSAVPDSLYYMEIDEIKDNIKNKLDEESIDISDEDLTALARPIYTSLRMREDTRLTERDTMAQARGKSVSEVIDDLKAQRAKYNLPDLPDNVIEEKAKRLHLMRNHPVIGTGYALGGMAYYIGRIIKLLHDSNKN